MKLTQDQQDLLDGKFGEGAKLAMKVQVAIGESFGAERMVPITRAHVALSNQDADRWLAEKLAGLGAKCRVRPTVNPGFCLSYFKKMGVVTNKDYEEMERTDRAYRALGAELSYNCTPYMDTNVPLFGEICAFSESSATPYVNSIWGARSNREGANSALFASITGYVPEYGLLLDENRHGNILVQVEADIKCDADYHILGMCGKKIGHGIPVFAGLPKNITKDLKKMVEEKQFREDLYYRLNVIPIHIEPLRNRKEDIEELSVHYIRRFSSLLGKSEPRITEDLMETLKRYPWPGNVRELENVMEYMVNLAVPGGDLDVDLLPKEMRKTPNQDAHVAASDLGIEAPIVPLVELEEAAIRRALLRYGRSGEGKLKAAQALGLSKATLYRKIKEYGV